jgi:HlyD family secretion protein
MPNADAATRTNARVLHDPEHLNEAIRLTARSTWILLAALGLCVAAVIAWGFLGRLDFHAQGQGVLLLDRSEVANVVARAGGTVSTIRVVPGQRVAAGDVLASVRLDEIAERRDQAKVALDAQRRELDKYRATSAADVTRRKADLDLLVKSLQADLAEADKNRAMLQKLYDDYVVEVQHGLATREQMQATFDRLNDVQQSIRQMTDKLSTSKTQQIEFEDEVARNISDLSMKVIEAKSRYDDLQVQFDVGSTIRSPVAGTVSEITTQLNQTVTAGDKLMVVESGTSARSLVAHAYMPIDQGKRVAVGMPAQISPTSIDDRIYGSIRGTVSSVSTLPMSRDGLMAVLGDPALVATMMAGGAPIEIEITLDADPRTADGLSWTSSVSPPTPVTAGTTVVSKVVVDRVSPVSLILPIAETWTHP